MSLALVRALLVGSALSLAATAVAQPAFVEIVDDFEDGDLAGWTLDDAGCADGASSWFVENGRLIGEWSSLDDCAVLWRADLVLGYDYAVEIVARSVDAARLRFGINYISRTAHAVVDVHGDGEGPYIDLETPTGELLPSQGRGWTGQFAIRDWNTYSIETFGRFLNVRTQDGSARADADFGAPRSGSVALFLPNEFAASGRIEIEEIRIRRPAPIVEIDTDTSPPYGLQSSIAINTRYMSSGRFQPGNVPLEYGFNVQRTTVFESSTFSATATNASGSSTDSVTITPDPPAFWSFRAYPGDVVAGSEVRLYYNVSWADSLVLQPGGSSLPVDVGQPGGETTVQVFETTTFRLTAFWSPWNPVTRNATVTVRPLSILSFQAFPNPVVPGGDVRLRWSTNAADSVLIDPIGLVGTDVEGEVVVNPTEPTDYTLRCRFAGQEVSQTLRVDIEPSRIRSFSSTATTIAPGDTTALRWNVSYGDSLVIEPLGIVSTDLLGGVDVAPTATTTYTARLFHEGVVTDEKTTTVTVLDIVFVDAGLSRTVQEIGGPVEVRWDVRPNDVEVFVDGDGPFPPAGRRTFHPIAPRTVVIEARRDGVSATRSFPLAVDDPAPDGENILLVADPVTLVPAMDAVPAGVLFDVYAMAAVPTAPVSGFAFDLEVPPCVVVVGVEYPPGFQSFSSPPNYAGVYGPINPCDTGGALVQLARFTMISFDDGAQGCFDTPRTIRAFPSTGLENGLRACGPDNLWTPIGAYGELVIGPGATVTAVGPTTPVPAGRDALLGNHPNPFNPRTTIRFRVGEPQTVGLRVVDVSGRTVRAATLDVSVAGEHTFVWNGRDARGDEVASGVYFAVLHTREGVFRSKMVLVR